MAARVVTPEELKAALLAYASEKDLTLSQGEGGSFTLMPGDIIVSLKEGRPACSDEVVYEGVMETLMNMVQEASKPPKTDDPLHRRENVPARASVPTRMQIRPGMAVRDVQVAELTFDDIKTYICPTANDQEVMIFLKLCQARNLNPFLRDAYLIKYDQTKPAQMVVGKEAFTKKAEDHPKFAGYKAGIIVKVGETLERREGTFWMEGETLVGGWAEVYRIDREKAPYKMEVPRKEYDTGKSNWATKPATMIRKVALVQALREAFPSELSGMYDSTEMGIDPEKEVRA